MNKKLTMIIGFFILGIVFCLTYTSNDIIEGFNNKECPNILIQDGNKIYLKNTKLAEIPGVNPIQFNNLNEYTEFTKWQRSQGINCPVLYLQKTYNAQSDEVYKIRPNINEPQGGLNPNNPHYEIANREGKLYETSLLTDSNRNDNPYNKNNYPSFDQDNQYIGLEVPIDKITQKNKLVSDNPMDKNWGGPKVTKRAIKSGKYKENEVSIYIP
jgi:hypothetical protein